MEVQCNVNIKMAPERGVKLKSLSAASLVLTLRSKCRCLNKQIIKQLMKAFKIKH